jgi:hypothetical protein
VAEKPNSKSKMVPVHSISKDTVKSLCSPQISFIDSYSMCIIGLRICVSDAKFSTASWIKNDRVKASLELHKVEVQISNSTCDSGNMITAGAILLKHPTFTHRMLLSLALRRQVPPNTPFSQIGVHKRDTKMGSNARILFVRCGQNHHRSTRPR